MHAKFFPSPSANAVQSLNFSSSLVKTLDPKKETDEIKKNSESLVRKKFIIFIDIIKTKLQETKI